MTGKITLYCSHYSPPARASWMVLKALEADFEVEDVDFGKGAHKEPEYLKVNRRGKLPGLKHGDLCLGESRAIMQYVCNVSKGGSKLYPTEPVARAKVDQMLYIDVDFVAAMYKYCKPYEILFLNQKPDLGKEEDLITMLQIYEDFLTERKFLAGDEMTIADFTGAVSLSILDYCKYDLSQFPRLNAWFGVMKGIPCYYECNGKHSDAVTAMYQEKIAAQEKY